MQRSILLAGGLALLLAACNRLPAGVGSPMPGMGPGMGMGGGMMQLHHASIPEEYTGLSNPVAVDDESLARGAEVYATYCATCHGDGGAGDGPAGAALDPPPAVIAHTSLMLSDAYLFWRISEGGAEFGTAMPAWKAVLEEQARWDVINYVRALGKGQVQPGMRMGGAIYDPQAEATRQAEVLATATAQGVITRAEAETFDKVHRLLQQSLAASTAGPGSGGMDEREAAILEELVAAGQITRAEADAFPVIHDRLAQAGLMP